VRSRIRDYPDRCTAGRMRVFSEGVKIIRRYRRYNRALDVGTGEGHFVKLCIDNGWQVWAIERDRDLAGDAQKKTGIDVFRGTLENARFPENFFDVVTFWNVLEHLPRPGVTLKEVNRILRPGGCVAARFPNVKFHWSCRRLFILLHKLWKGTRKLDATAIHLYGFDRASMRAYLLKSGFNYYIIKNANTTWSSLSLYESGLRKITGILINSFLSLTDFLSGGKLLIGPSLFVLARKAENGLSGKQLVNSENEENPVDRTGDRIMVGKKTGYWT
jgi:SAM-dependent methyltransferase